ncbi:l-type lectin-domain containing receptor kinase ix.1 [Quercus suber]|uniref:non-specific serine/threonine protein kinase n=1 Tax=Quercus suber TaxID=58331 RepID=A0AAW0KPM6_QUESU
MQLFDPITGKSTDFTTHFSFKISTITSPGQDGLTFFLAPNGSHLPNDAEGGCLALISKCHDFTLHRKELVAVEFDTYNNTWDETDSEHVGININPIKSAVSTDLSRTHFLVGILFGFSAGSAFYFDMHDILSWEFETNFSSEGSQRGLIIGSVIGGFFSACGIVLILVLVWRGSREKVKDGVNNGDSSMEREMEHGTGPKRFSYDELVRATNNFAEDGKLGEGGFGGVYKGFLSDLHEFVAVKKVSKRSNQGKKEYISEVKIISRLTHKNLVQLVGWCHEFGDLLLVYEFMPHGSLDFHLFGERTTLDWATRYKITLNLASALLYLHEDSGQCVVHRDIKSSNIMLDSDFNAKLGDFGLARLMDEKLGIKTTGLAGTFGYMAPEYISMRKATKGSNVFSFGVVALEIACGKRSTEPEFEGPHVPLVALVWESYRNERLLDMADRRLSMEFDMKQVECLLITGLWCAHLDKSMRPSIREAI